MLDDVRAAIDRLEVPTDGDVIAEAFRLIDRLTAKAFAAVGEFDAQSLWELDGATSMTAWLRHRAGMTEGAAKSAVSTAARLRRLPVTATAWQSGALSGGQVQAVMANIDDRTAPLFGEHEAAVVPTLEDLSVRETAFAMQAWKARAEALLGVAPRDGDREVHLSRTLDGRFRLDGALDPVGGEVVSAALRLAATGDAEGEPVRTPGRRRADALVDVCRFFLDHQHGRRGGRHRPHLNVVVAYDDLVARRGGRFVDGGRIDPASLQALLCDAAVHRVVTDGRSATLDYGTATRTVPAPLWSALVLRDQHCRFDGCDRPSQWCEAHHVVPVLDGGATSLENLVLKCSRHHHLGHQPGWAEKLEPDGTLVITDPKGCTRTTRPPGHLAATA